MNALDVIYTLGAVALSPVWARKSRGDWPARFGHTPALPKAESRTRRVLVHAVSVGEVNACRQLVAQLRDAGCEVVLCVTTDNGIARARALYQGSAVPVVRYPLDFSRSVSRFLDAVAPDLVCLVELEVWPNFVRACSKRGIPVGVVNGRLSERSFGGYRRIAKVIGPAFAKLAFAAVQDEPYAARFAAMGTPRERVTVTGSVKWDAVPPHAFEAPSEGAIALAEAMGIDRSKPIVVFGSTAKGEEALAHAAMPLAVQLVCAPRKPERFADAAGDLPGCVRRSSGIAAPAGTMRFLLDSLGELGQIYQLADVVVIGRTFTRQGGSDPMEPAGLGKPLVCGPDMGNFLTVASALVGSGGMMQVGSSELASMLGQLCASQSRRDEMREANLRCVQVHRGATVRTCEIILKALRTRAS